MTDDVIGQAIEVIAQRYDIDADAAQAMLTRLSTYLQQPATDLARGLIARFSAPTTADPSRAGGPQPGRAADKSQHDIHARMAILIRDVQEQEPAEVVTVLDQLTLAAAQYVPGAQYAGITAIDRHGGINTAAATGDYPGLLDVIQNRHREGPSLQAAREHHTVRVDDLSSDARWPRYRRNALAQTPIRSVLSFAIVADWHTIGALNVYAEYPDAFGVESEDVGFVCATYATLAWNALRRDKQFRSALASRDIIGQAKGVLMERLHIDAVAAFAELRRRSQESNRRVVEISRSLVEGAGKSLP